MTASMNTAVETSVQLPQSARWDSLAWVQVGTVSVLLGLLYYRILGTLVFDWVNDPNYSHGFFIPLFCAWVIWKQRKSLAIIPAEPSYVGLAVIVGALG